MKNKKRGEEQLELSKEQIDSVYTLYSSGKIHEAIDAIKALNENYPNVPLLFNIIGACYEALGQLDGAAKMFETAVTIKPDYAEAHFNHGVILSKIGQLDLAVESFKKAIALIPNYHDAHNNLGNAFLNLNQYDDAVEHFEWAIAYKPEFAEAYNNLGVVERKQKKFDQAIKSFEKAIDIQPNYVQAHSNRGNTLQDIGQLDAAITCYENALAINPNYAQCYLDIGLVHLEQGQIDDAIKLFKKALAINPNYAAAYYNLSLIKKYTINKKQITKMQSLLSSDKLSPLDRRDLCFALAKVNENLDNHDDLFKYLHEGNRLRKQELNYSLDRSLTLFSTVKEMFSSRYLGIEKSLSSEPSTFKPIFIVGMPRSGTTLVEQIISSHHAVHGAGELPNLATIIEPIGRGYLNQGMNKLPKKTFFSIREQYLDVLSNLNVPESVITEKLPLNFLYIGFILTAFPEAKIVHMKRDARAICWSIYKTYFSDAGNGYSYNLDDLAEFYGLYTDLMDFWHQFFPDEIYDMCYEDLTTNQEEETKKLLQYCELDWDENCLSFHKNKRAVKTASSIQVREKMYQGSSEAWKKYEAHLKPLIKALSSY